MLFCFVDYAHVLWTEGAVCATNLLTSLFMHGLRKACHNLDQTEYYLDILCAGIPLNAQKSFSRDGRRQTDELRQGKGNSQGGIKNGYDTAGGLTGTMTTTSMKCCSAGSLESTEMCARRCYRGRAD